LLLAQLGCLLPASVLSHGNMVVPYTWQDTAGLVGMTAGATCLPGLGLTNVAPGVRVGTSCMWFNNYTRIPGEPTLDPAMRTFWFYSDEGVEVDVYTNRPWRAPGTAPLHSPCGVAGGNPDGCPVGAPPGEDTFDCFGVGYSYGPRAETVEFPAVVTTEWTRGDVAEVAWGIVANHGGGYSYRLCKVPEDVGVAGITEEVCQKGVLEFASDMQWVQYGRDENTRVAFPANRTREGTTPPGSQWTRNPIPACRSVFGGAYDQTPDCPRGTQFPPPAEGLFGYGMTLQGGGTFKFSIVDEVIVPDHLEPGRYVLSFRWDCEMTTQVWSSCANILLL